MLLSSTKKEKFLSYINPIYACRKYKIPLRQCPQFLFLVMGLFIIAAIILTWFIATAKIKDPLIVSLIVLAAGGFLMLLSFVITNSFEKMAEVSRMKTEFIGIVSHQLRTPLTNLKFSLDFLLSDRVNKVESDLKEHLAVLEENTKRIDNLVDRLLIISKLESDVLPFEKKDISLEQITNDLLVKNKPFIDASGVRVVLDMQQEIGKVLADPFWLEQVIGNLLDNAVRYSKRGGEIHISIKEKKGRAFFAIKDQGVGIPKHEQKFIFEKFFRSVNALKKQAEGSGLGLHIVKKFIEILGGRVWFESIENKGTTFYFTLPLIR